MGNIIKKRILRRLHASLSRGILPPLERFQRHRALLLYRILHRCRLLPSYQPAPWVGIGTGRRARATQGRWAAIESELAHIPAGTALDLGSHIGFFSFKLAESGHLCLGIENFKDSIRAARLLRTASGIEGASFRQMTLNSETIRELPDADIIVFLSLWHHLCKAEGFERARELLTTVISKTRQVCFFETGQSDEAYMQWASDLPEMKPDVKTWISSLLKDCGATSVKHLGTFSAYLGPVKRHLFAAYT